MSKIGKKEHQNMMLHEGISLRKLQVLRKIPDKVVWYAMPQEFKRVTFMEKFVAWITQTCMYLFNKCIFHITIQHYCI